MIHHNLADRLFDSARPLHGLRPSDQRGRHENDIAAHDRLGLDAEVGFALDPQPLNGLLRAGAQFVVVRALVDDGCITIGDVGDVGRLIDDGHIAFDWNDSLLDALRTELIRWHERILIRTDVIIIVSPIVDAAAPIEARFRWKGRPADIIVALAPGNPGGCPLRTGNPDPSDVAQSRPASVMIGRPTEWLFRDPGPAGVGIDPAAIDVGPPVA